MQKITPFLWFDGKVEEAAKFYVSLFKNSRILEQSGHNERVQSVTFQLEGQTYIAFNGGPMFKFNEAISLFVDCETQEEVDRLWDKLREGGQELQCGWVRDRFGLVWQIIPSLLGKYLQDKDPAKAGRVMEAMMKMKKIIIKDLQAAYDKK